MRLLHVSDLLLGNRNYRREVRDANGADLIDLDRRAAFDRAVGCAIEYGVDALLVCGGLLDGRADLAEYEPWLAARLAQLRAAGVTPVIYDPGDQAGGLDAVLVRDDAVASAAGVVFAPLHLAQDVSRDHSDAPIVAVGHGCLEGVGGGASFDRKLDDRLAAGLGDDIAYVALGGMLETQPVTPTAWFSGSACGVFAYHPGDPGGLVVQLGPSTRRLLDLTHVRWDCRRRVSVTIDAGGMDVDALAGVLHARLDPVCWAVDPHEPLAADHPLAELYGAPSCSNGVGWWSRPVIQLSVFGTPHTLDDVFAAHPGIEGMLSGGEHLLAIVKWEQPGAKARTHKLVPQR